MKIIQKIKAAILPESAKAQGKLDCIRKRNAARQSRWRKNNPEKHAEQQRKYRMRRKASRFLENQFDTLTSIK